MGDYKYNEYGEIQIETPKYPNSIFVSHDARDCQFAKLFCKLVEGASQELLHTFCSSRTGDINYGDEWYKKLMTEIDSSNAIVCLLTRNSLKKPWILFEAGLAKGKAPNKKIRALVIDTKVKPQSPFSHFQQCRCERESVMQLIIELIEEHTNLPKSNRDTLI